MQQTTRGRPFKRRDAQRLIAALVCGVICLHVRGVTAGEVAAKPGSSRATCAAIQCLAHPMTRTPFRTSAATYNSGRLCFTLDSDRRGSFPGACRGSAGPQQLFVSVPDATVRTPTLTSAPLRRTSYPAAQYTHPRCVPGIGIASLVQRQSGAVPLVRGGFPVNFCYTYSPSTPFRQIAIQTEKRLTKPASQPCCSPSLGFTTPQTSIQLQAVTRTSKGGFGCVGCNLQGTYVAKAAAQGFVWQDNDQNSAYSADVDSGFEGIVVNLYRAVGSALTFLGCTDTDGTGFFQFTQLIPDTYVLEVVKPAVVAGGAYSFQFARQALLASSQGSSVNSIGRTTPSFYLASTTTVRNALLQVKFA